MKERSLLKSIQIKNLGVIDSANLDLKEGLTVLTGETGAGKTMVLTALNLITGGKADQKLIRSGAEKLIVAAEFQIDEELVKKIEDLGGEVDDGVLLITRTINNEGKSRATLGGIPIPIATLGEFSQDLIEIHAQSSSQRLAKESVQRELIDKFAKNEDLLHQYQKQLTIYREVSSRLLDLENSLKNREVEIARLNEIVALTKKFELTIDIYTEIDNEIMRLEGIEDLNKSISSALEILNNDESNLLASLHGASKYLNSAKEIDKSLQMLVSEFSEGIQSINSAVQELSNYREKLNANPARFDFLQSRKAELIGLAKRFGKIEDRNEAINSIVEESRNAKAQIEDLSGGEDRVNELKVEKLKEFQKLVDSAAKLTKSRSKAAKEIESQIIHEFTELALPGALIQVLVTAPSDIKEKDLTLFGVDSIEINFASHKSAKLSPLIKSASGGELSRVMLALEVVLSRGAKIGTYIFDEVDAGVGGKSAIEVGKKLAKIASSSQVLVVTHLPQVAVWAENHLIVEKSDKGDITESSVFEVSGERRKVEIARLLSGQESSESAREHAQELLELAANSAIR